MTPILMTGPVAEPLSLDEARAWLRLDTHAEDDLVTSLVRAARSAIEQATRRALMAQSWRLRLDRWPPNGIVNVPLAPVFAIEAVRVFDAAGVAIPLALGGFRLDQSFGTRIFCDTPPPAPGRLYGGIEIDLTAGYGASAAAVPEPLRQAMRLLVAFWFEHRGDALHDNAVPHLPAAVAALVVPFRSARLG
ncbi:MAG: phage gp6-like head-tail connector family protein [Hyphomicrobiales bacterium]|nr:phage gp6-like head-tail connector family protein [Hyphomicrobiales bacterium]